MDPKSTQLELFSVCPSSVADEPDASNVVTLEDVRRRADLAQRAALDEAIAARANHLLNCEYYRRKGTT